MGERPDAVDVPDGPEALARAQMLVNRDAAVGVGRYADGLQPDPGNAWAPAGCDEQPVAPQLWTIIESQDKLVTFPPGGGGALPEYQLDPVPAQGLAERLAQRRGLAGKHPVGALNDHRLAAQAPHDLRELNAGRPAAQYEQASRNRLHAGRLAGTPDALKVT